MCPAVGVLGAWDGLAPGRPDGPQGRLMGPRAGKYLELEVRMTNKGGR